MDLRSDTVTQPTPAMRSVMANAPVGDDVYDEDPTVHRLEATAAELLGQEAALFVVSGSMANLLGVWLNVDRGAEILCDSLAHIVRAELGAHAALHGITTRTWQSQSGIADWRDIEPLISAESGHLVTTQAVELENTLNFASGAIQPLSGVRRISWACRERGLGLHIDGARLANACVATGTTLADFGSLATTVSLCLSKGLGAPIGSILASTSDRIAAARVERKRLGAGWRQAGILAAAGLFALNHQYDRLSQDHEAAQTLAAAIRSYCPQAVPRDVATNIVLINPVDSSADQLLSQAADQGVRLSKIGPQLVRAVTHLGISLEEAHQAGQIIGQILA
ncbi:MAG: low specificity L-threonine aldolase [Propionibacteriaceae bacterium]|jgi:threonine aldolase|nr:low specificity L-threonine aldolase [Propionibacteriaceae bacterium]